MADSIQFADFMRSYQNMVFSTAVRLLGNETDAEDISQEVFLKAYERFDELAHSPTVGGWLKTVTRNLCLNHLSRYRARWRFFSEMFASDEAGEERVFEIPAPETTSDQLNEVDQRRLLEQALQKLPAAQRVPLVLFHFENLGYEEIAAQLRVSLAKVKTDIFRGRAALRKKLRVGSEQEWADYQPRTRTEAESKPAQNKPNPMRFTKSLLASPETLSWKGLTKMNSPI
jgi:RNA polymerase sigma-70 factor (ECF subfamily)